MIEQVYLDAEQTGLTVYSKDEAGLYQAVPHLSEGWQPVEEPARQPHEYSHIGTAKLLTLFHPASGQLHVKGMTSCTNTVLRPWLQHALTDVLDHLQEAPVVPLEQLPLRRQGQHWQEGLSVKVSQPETPLSFRMLSVRDNLKGQKTPAFIRWLVDHAVMPLYTPIAGSMLHMRASVLMRASACWTLVRPGRALLWTRSSVGSCCTARSHGS